MDSGLLMSLSLRETRAAEDGMEIFSASGPECEPLRVTEPGAGQTGWLWTTSDFVFSQQKSGPQKEKGLLYLPYFRPSCSVLNICSLGKPSLQGSETP